MRAWTKICSSKSRMCDLVSLPHRCLKGVGPDGQCWSKVAESYPKGVCVVRSQTNIDMSLRIRLCFLRGAVVIASLSIANLLLFVCSVALDVVWCSSAFGVVLQVAVGCYSSVWLFAVDDAKAH